MINRFISENPSFQKPANDISVEQITDLDEQLGEMLYRWKSLIEFVKELKSSAWLTHEQADFIVEMFWCFSEFDDKNSKKIYSPIECRLHYTQIMSKIFFNEKIEFSQFRIFHSFKWREWKNFTEDVLQKFKDLLQGEIGWYIEQNSWKIAAQKIVWETSEFAKSLIIEKRVS
jgi:hypothetical protein